MVKETEIKEDGSNGFAIASLVVGIIGLLLFLMPYFGIVFSILAMVFYGYGRKNGIGLSGLILGIIGTVINAFMLICVIIYLVAI